MKFDKYIHNFQKIQRNVIQLSKNNTNIYTIEIDTSANSINDILLSLVAKIKLMI